MVDNYGYYFNGKWFPVIGCIVLAQESLVKKITGSQSLVNLDWGNKRIGVCAVMIV